MTVRPASAAMPVPGVAADRPEPAVLAALVDISTDGLALLADDGRYLWANRAAGRILGLDPVELVGTPSVFAEGADTGIVRWCRPASHRERELEFRFLAVTAGRAATAVAFRDVTELRQQQRRSIAFATAAASVADGGSLRGTLDAICAEVVRTTDLAGAQILLLDPDGRLCVHGAAPAEAWPVDFTVRLEEARRRGARLMALDAIRSQRAVVRRGRKAALLADPAWAPLHGQILGFDWDSFVSAPLCAGGGRIGALNAYYRPGHDPDDDEIAFLAAMADHAAVAAENGRLLAESRSRAALDERHRLSRELHDSACQQLFSMTLHLRAAELALAPRDGQTRATLRTVQQLAHAALDDLRALIVELYPPLLHSEGLVAVVRQQAASTASRLGRWITVDAPEDRLHIAAEAELDVHRLVQEALHNAVKHAPEAAIRVRLGPASDNATTLLVEVADDGPGFDPAASATGLGLVSMRERSERLGGQLSIESAPGSGTVVRAVLPRVLGARG
jgi:signal transduction histidine kinase